MTSKIGTVPKHRSIELPPGLVAVTGDEHTGKTQLLRQLAGDVPTSREGSPRGKPIPLQSPSVKLSSTQSGLTKGGENARQWVAETQLLQGP